MLRTNDIVVVKDAKGHVIATKEYERVYLSHSQEDETEVVDVSADGNVVGKKTRPRVRARLRQKIFSLPRWSSCRKTTPRAIL